MQINQEKLQRQLEGIDKAVINFHQGKGATLEWCTGMGKTFGSLLLHEKMQKTKPDRTTIVVVPYTFLKEQWEEEIVKRKAYNILTYFR
jgi:superfamily II DNA or RNA helicase